MEYWRCGFGSSKSCGEDLLMKVKVINGGYQRMFAGVEQKDGVIGER